MILNQTALPHSPRRRVARGLTTVVGATTAAFVALGFAAGPALADAGDGTYVNNELDGLPISTNQGDITANLFNLELTDGTVLHTYCIDFETEIKNGASYEQDTWENYPGQGEFAEPAKVHWILQNSYPSVDADTLAGEAQIDGLNDEQAMSGTQAAIWHFSNDVELDEDNDPAVQQVYDYLVDNAEELPQTGEPEQSLEIAVEEYEGDDGLTFGKYTVETSADSVPLEVDAPEGVELVDLESGETIDSASDGDEFTVQVPEDSESGEAAVTGSVTTDVETGLLYKGLEGQEPTQTLISAGSGEATVEDGGSVSWETVGGDEPEPEPSVEPEPEPSDEPEPEPSEDEKPAPDNEESDEDNEGGLPVTGGALTGLIIAAVIALAAGGTALFLSRKRRTATLEG